MIRWIAVWAVAMRHLHVWKRDINLVLMSLYWPLLDIILWGGVGLWMQQLQPDTAHYYALMTLSGMLLWQVVGRGCNFIVMAFTEEIWAHNVVNLFSLPLSITEWLCGMVVFFSIMMGLCSLFCIIVIATMYTISFWQLMTIFMIFIIPLFFSALWIGFTALTGIIALGKRGIELGFVISWCMMPFSGFLYPIEILPTWAQTISTFIPMQYVSQGMRAYIMYQSNPVVYIIKGLALSILYAGAALLLFLHCFNYSKQKGLARLTD